VQNGYSPREIIFNVKGKPDPVPIDQLTLKTDIESVLTILQVIFPEKKWQLGHGAKTVQQRRFEEYLTKLVGIAQVGLQTPANPEIARAALEGLRAEILTREGPRVKNS
jgi:hypothetical protein